jgi:SAM-dependent methyltransferase
VADRKAHYQEYFAGRQPSSFGVRVHRFWHSRMLDRAEKVIPGMRGWPLLELGPGLGTFGEICKSRGYSYSGVEMNECQALKLRAQGLDVVSGSIPPIPDGRPARIIWMSHFLEHAATFLEARQMVEEAYRRLEEGGYVIIISPDCHSWKNHFYDVDWSHGYPTALKRTEQLLQETGFAIFYSRHHTATFFHPIGVFFLTGVFRLLPVKLLDVLAENFTGRPLVRAFMVLLGWRQIFVVGRKTASLPQGKRTDLGPQTPA